MTRISHARARALAPASSYASDLEAAFFAALALHGADLPPPCRELVFAPPRRWRFDAAWPAALVAAECDGGQWAAGGGRHNTDADREKLNQAAAMGWRVLRFSASMLTDNPIGCVEMVRAALNQSDRARETIDTLLDCGCISCRSCRDLANITLGRPMEDMP